MAEDLCLLMDSQAIYCCQVLFLIKGSSFGASPARGSMEPYSSSLDPL